YRKYTDRRQFCGIGSVKSNVGHLDSVAGLAGCIKLALALQSGEIPPTLHFREANPKFTWAASPFYVVADSMSWPRTGTPRRGALSSFGIGGTNAHLILEAYERPERSVAGLVTPVVVPLSARNPERLREYAQRLLAYMRDLGDSS